MSTPPQTGARLPSKRLLPVKAPPGPPGSTTDQQVAIRVIGIIGAALVVLLVLLTVATAYSNADAFSRTAAWAEGIFYVISVVGLVTLLRLAISPPR